MTVQEWLKHYGFDVEFNRRGFRIETPNNGISNVFVIGEGVKIVKHITWADVHVWIKRRIKFSEITLTRQAELEFKEVTRD